VGADRTEADNRAMDVGNVVGADDIDYSDNAEVDEIGDEMGIIEKIMEKFKLEDKTILVEMSSPQLRQLILHGNAEVDVIVERKKTKSGGVCNTTCNGILTIKEW